MRKGQTIGNSQTGETLTMLVDEEESNGTLQVYRVQLPPRRPGPPLHFHVAFEETFSVLEGTLDVYLGRTRKHIQLASGQSVTAEIRQLHTFCNSSDKPCIMTVETRPAGGVVKAFQLAYGIANEGGAGKDGLPRNILIRLRFIQIAQGSLPKLPLPFQRTIFWFALIITRLTGIERRIRRYTSDLS